MCGSPSPLLMLKYCMLLSVVLFEQEKTMGVVLDRPDLREKEHDAFIALPQDLQTEIMQIHHASVLKKR